MRSSIINTQKSRSYIVLFAVLIGMSMPGVAQTFPAKSVRMIIPTTAGGSSDTLARMIGQRLTERWGEQVLVDNRPGGHGVIGMEMLAKAPADGHTLLMGNIGTVAINSGLYAKLPYDISRDFTPLSLMTKQAFMLGITAGLPVKNLSEFIKLAKNKPGQLNYGSAGNGSGTHVSVEMLKLQTGINIIHVPYKGSSQVVTDLIAGHVQAYMSGVFTLLPYMKSGKVRGLAVANDKRLSIAPELATFEEAGLKNFVLSQWQGILAPAKLPIPLVSKIYGDLQAVMLSTEIQDRLAREGVEVVASSPQEFDGFIQAEIKRWSRVIKEAGVKID